MDGAYTWYVNLNPDLVHDLEHLISLFNTKFFCAEVKFTLAELGRMFHYPMEDSNAYVKRFHEKKMDYYDSVIEDVLVDVCLHQMIENT